MPNGVPLYFWDTVTENGGGCKGCFADFLQLKIPTAASIHINITQANINNPITKEENPFLGFNDKSAPAIPAIKSKKAANIKSEMFH